MELHQWYQTARAELVKSLELLPEANGKTELTWFIDDQCGVLKTEPVFKCVYIICRTHLLLIVSYSFCYVPNVECH